MEFKQSRVDIRLINQLYTFYKNKKILITGHNGFKGTWLTLWLQRMGAKIAGLSLSPPSQPNFYELCGIDQDILSFHCDIRNLIPFSKCVTEFKPDIIIHMAAQSLVKKSFNNPLETYSTNIMGTINLFEIVRLDNNVRVVLNVTSDKCYENQEWVWGYRECDPMGGFDPYSSSKGCSEIITSAYIRSFFSQDPDNENGNTFIASARAGNVIGGGDFAADRLIPDIIRAFLKKEKVILRNPHSVRPWQFVLEPLTGYLLLAQKLYEEGFRFSSGWNFGPEMSSMKDVSYIADKFTSIWGDGAGWSVDTSSTKDHESNLLRLDCSKARCLLGWQPILDIDQSLEWTAEWYKKFRDSPNGMDEFSEAQIKAYEALFQ